MVGTTPGSGSYGNQTTQSGQTGNVKYNTPPSQVASQISDGDEFILLKRSRQGSEPQVWSSGDPQQTQQMFRDIEAKVQSESLETTSR